MTKFEEKLQYMTPLAKPYNEDGSLNYYPAPQNTSGYNVLANYGKDNYTNEFIKNAAYLTGYINIRFSKYLNNRIYERDRRHEWRKPAGGFDIVPQLGDCR